MFVNVYLFANNFQERKQLSDTFCCNIEEQVYLADMHDS